MHIKAFTTTCSNKMSEYEAEYEAEGGVSPVCMVCMSHPRNVRLSCGHSCCSHCLDLLISGCRFESASFQSLFACPWCRRRSTLQNVKIWPSIAYQAEYRNPESGSYQTTHSIVKMWVGKHDSICSTEDMPRSISYLALYMQQKAAEMTALNEIREDALTQAKMEATEQEEYHRHQQAVLVEIIRTQRDQEDLHWSVLCAEAKTMCNTTPQDFESLFGKRGEDVRRFD